MKCYLGLMLIFLASCTTVTRIKKERVSNASKNTNVCNNWFGSNANGLGLKAIEEILDHHNFLRNQVASGNSQNEANQKLPKARDMVQMMWNRDIAKKAQAHANECTFRHSTSEFRSQPNFPTGENLYVSSQKPGFPTMNWKNAIDGWYNEILDFDPLDVGGYIANSSGKVTGHFTQLAWAHSYMVGCGFAQYTEEDGWNTNLYVCEYGPVGNILETPIYNAVQEGKSDECECLVGLECKSMVYPKLCCREGSCRTNQKTENEYILVGDDASLPIQGSLPDGLMK